jgi:predicted amidohydrolase
MNLAAVQLDIQWEDRPANHARVRQLLDRAEVPRDALVVLPEMFDVGFSMNTARTDPGEPSASEAFCRQLAIDRKVAVLAGCVARAGRSNKLANEAVAFAPDGSLLARYRKQQPFTPPGEHVHYPAGEAGHVLFEWQGVRIAPFICYDLRFPELFRPAAFAGAELIAVIASWPCTRSEHWVRLLQARAIENLAFTLGVNRCGSDPSYRYDGRSCLFNYMGEEVFQADDRQQVLTAEIDPAPLRAWREQFPALCDARRS